MDCNCASLFVFRVSEKKMNEVDTYLCTVFVIKIIVVSNEVPTDAIVNHLKERNTTKKTWLRYLFSVDICKYFLPLI